MKAEPKFLPAMILLLPFATEFARRGGDVERALNNKQIPTDVLANPTMLVEARACYELVEDMASLLGDPFIGAMLAIDAASTGTPAIRDAAAKATTFADFLSRFVIEIDSQVNNVRHYAEVSHSTSSFEIRRRIKPFGTTTQIDAVNITFCVSLFKRGLGGVFDPARILVLAPSTEGVPANFLPRQALLKSRLNGIKISFPSEWLCAPFSLDWRTDDVPMGRTFTEEGVHLLGHFRTVLEKNIDQGDLSLHRFAGLLGLHPRRVQRILSANRTSYRKLKTEVRRGLALDLLEGSVTPVPEIASQVGFSEVSAFYRAFRQWTGTTPIKVRNASLSAREHNRSGPRVAPPAGKSET